MTNEDSKQFKDSSRFLKPIRNHACELVRYIEDHRDELSQEQVNCVTDLIFRLWELQNEFYEKFRKIGG